jgi:osmotically-inducible protein OsmY
MLKRLAITAAWVGIAAVAAGGPAFAQDKPQEKPDETKIVIKDDTTPKVKKASKAVTDASITSAVKTRLMKDKVARGTSIDVSTKDGVVTIAGSVPSEADKTRIGNLVAHTTGVKSVENQLTATGTPAATTGKDETKIVIKDDTTPAVKKGANAVKKGAAKTVDVVSDSSVATAVKTRLMGDDVARATSIDVKADEGVVTISGTVPTAADKTRIGNLVARTTGVKRVVNDLTVGK